MNWKVQPRTPGIYIASEVDLLLSRESITINATAGKLLAGTVIAQITSDNTAADTPAATNTGDAAMTGEAASNAATTGTYTVEVTKADAGEGKPAEFIVTDPLGNTATGVAGVKFEGLGIEFTITDATAPSTPAAVGDSWTIAVTEGKGEWTAFDPAGPNDGRRTAGAILYATVDSTSADAQAVATARLTAVTGSELIWPDGISDANKTTAIAALAAKHIIVV